MSRHDVRTLSLLGVLGVLILVRHTRGYIERGPLGWAFALAVFGLGALPLFFRLAKRPQTPPAAPSVGPYRSLSAPAEPTVGRASRWWICADVLCLVLALSVWAELRSEEPLQRIHRRPVERQCIVAPC